MIIFGNNIFKEIARNLSITWVEMCSTAWVPCEKRKLGGKYGRNVAMCKLWSNAWKKLGVLTLCSWSFQLPKLRKEICCSSVTFILLFAENFQLTFKISLRCLFSFEIFTRSFIGGSSIKYLVQKSIPTLSSFQFLMKSSGRWGCRDKIQLFAHKLLTV